jgi:co-chaperonin GroES (HSP10)
MTDLLRLAYSNEEGEIIIEIPPIIPYGDKILIYLEPEQDHYSEAPSIVRAETAKQDHVFRVGRVCRIGPGEINKKGKRIPPDIKLWSRVLFIKFIATHTQTAERLRSIIGKDFALIDKDDVLLELDNDVDIGSISQ